MCITLVCKKDYIKQYYGDLDQVERLYKDFAQRIKTIKTDLSHYWCQFRGHSGFTTLQTPLFWTPDGNKSVFFTIQ